MKLWVVGKINPANFKEWEFQGVFDDEEKAIEACTDETFFIGPTTLNEPEPIASIDWPEAYYPKAI